MSGLFAGTPLERPVTCERCGKAVDRSASDACACPRDADGAPCPPSEQHARVRREKRRGKWVTVIEGLDPVASDLDALCASFRKTLGTGGAVTKPARERLRGKGDKGGKPGEAPSAPVIELQGDHAEATLKTLIERGYPAKRAGG